MSRRSTTEMFAVIAGPPTMGLKKGLDIILRLLTQTDTTLAEFLSSSALMAVGFIMALPQETLTLGTPMYEAMRRFLPEGGWALAFFAFGLFQSVANLTRNKKMRRLAAFWCFVFFGFVGALGAVVYPVSLFGAFCKVDAVGNAIIYLQLRVHGERGAN